jgi:hypothetical protein
MVLVASTPAIADEIGDRQDVLVAERWHDVPIGNQLKLSQQIADQLAELGNFIGDHINVLSDDVLALRFDGRGRRARVRFGTGEGEFLRFKLDSNWHFTQGRARIAAKVELGIGSHEWHLDLPDVEMLPTSVYGERGVELRLPLFERSW